MSLRLGLCVRSDSSADRNPAAGAAGIEPRHVHVDFQKIARFFSIPYRVRAPTSHFLPVILRAGSERDEREFDQLANGLHWGVRHCGTAHRESPLMPHEIDFLESYDCASIANELRRIARLLGKRSLSTTEINRHGRVSADRVYRKFGSLNGALLAAGLKPSRNRPDSELLKILSDLWVRTERDHGRSPVMADLKAYGIDVPWWTYGNRFGSWKVALLLASRLGNVESTSGARIARDLRTPVSVSKRFRVFQRDLYQCRICHASGVPLEVDHIIPVSRGGSNDMANLQALCVPCNRGKSDRLQ